MKIKDWTKPTALFIGRFQPWKKGHRSIVDEIFYKGDSSTSDRFRTSQAQQIIIMVRTPEKTDEYKFEDIQHAINEDLQLDYPNRFEVIEVPNITNVFVGRSIGFDMERIFLSDDLESVDDKTTTTLEAQHFNKEFWSGRG